MEIKSLRKKYPKFIYEKYSYKISNNNLEIFFNFIIPPDIKFQPKIIIEKTGLPAEALAKAGDRVLDNLIFHIGLMEIPSYWKATCSPTIEIRSGYLNSEQIKWWKSLIIDGMGQFFYENKINWKSPNFLQIISSGPKISWPYLKKLKNRFLIPFAGGRDSIVTLEKIKEKYGSAAISLFTVNPIEKIQRTFKVSGIQKQIIVKREIDKKILDLNKKGYLNGHTPFTSLLSFISVLCAVIFDYKNIAFSNEKSANEGNLKYLGKIINHQWAKSSEFEKRFVFYARKYLAKDINYFSYLRKYGELEISKMLVEYPQYFPVFSSCNAGMRIDEKGSLRAKERWCGNCPKCLFVYMTLYPFLSRGDLLKIFDKDIFQNKKLLSTLKRLVGDKEPKPLECVGTKTESRKAFDLCLKKARAYRQAGKKIGEIPHLLLKILQNGIK